MEGCVCVKEMLVFTLHRCMTLLVIKLLFAYHAEHPKQLVPLGSLQKQQPSKCWSFCKILHTLIVEGRV